MLIRAGASNRTMVAALGVNIRLLYTVVFGFGAALAGLAGLMAGALGEGPPGVGDQILPRVVVVIALRGQTAHPPCPLRAVPGRFVGWPRAAGATPLAC